MNERDWISLIADLMGIIFGVLGLVLYFASENLNRKSQATLIKMEEATALIKDRSLKMVEATLSHLLTREAEEESEKALATIKEVQDRMSRLETQSPSSEDWEEIRHTVEALDRKLGSFAAFAREFASNTAQHHDSLLLEHGLDVDALWNAWKITGVKLTRDGASLYLSSLVEILKRDLSVSVIQARILSQTMLEVGLIRLERDATDREIVVLAENRADHMPRHADRCTDISE